MLDKEIDNTYTRWFHHGEAYEVLSEDEDDDVPSGDGSEGLQEMLEDLERGSTIHVMPKGDASSSSDPRESSPLGLMFKDAKLPLYPGCEMFSKLEFHVELLYLKTINIWTNISFIANIGLVKRALSEGKTLPSSYYEMRKYMRDIGLGYIPIHVCKHDCMIFWKETEKEEKCLICNEP